MTILSNSPSHTIHLARLLRHLFSRRKNRTQPYERFRRSEAAARLVRAAVRKSEVRRG